MRTALVTGSSVYWIFVCQRLLEDGFRVVGIDCMTDYYDVLLKEKRQSILLENKNFHTIKAKIESSQVLMDLFALEKPDVVIHLAAQAGVRYSIENPRTYLEGNINGTFELLEAARAYPPQHMLLASTSSPMEQIKQCRIRKPIRLMRFLFMLQLKRQRKIWRIPTTSIRPSYHNVSLFTIYGPWGRPDMAPHKFTKAILNGEPIDVYNHGNMERDFTYVTDPLKLSGYF